MNPRSTPGELVRNVRYITAMPEQPQTARVGIVTTSDRASRGEYVDKGTPELEAALREFIATPIDVHARLIPDERAEIEKTLKALVDDVGCCLVVTTGGTGPAKRDVTVDATLAVGEQHMPGFGELLRKVWLERVR